MLKVKFVVGLYGRLMGHIAGIQCLLEDCTAQPKAGETWLVKITGTNARRTMLYVRAVHPWQDRPEDRRAIVQVRVDFRDGMIKFPHRFAFPAEHTLYAQLWEDYKLLTDNMNAVIIRGDKAIRWNKKGKPPQVLPLHRFATKYRHQPLLGKPDDIDHFLANLDDLRNESIESARKRRSKDRLHL
ncbi:MAG TPA: hypothetical protein VMW83_17250 [Spirochaetia bacterium]|nr:hypothetical protein [Spirochaetia bacterium]